MLDSIRKRKDSFISTFIILAVVAVMAFYGLGQLTKDNDVGGGAAAWVNGEMISKREFQQEWERRIYQYQSLLGGQFDQRLLDQLQLPQRTLDELVQYKLLAQQAKKMGIVVPDSELADHIRGLPYYQKDGKFNYDLYSKIPNRGQEEKARREQLAVTKLQGYLNDRIRLPLSEVERSYQMRETKVDLDYAKIDLNALAGSRKATPAQVDAFLKTAKNEELEAYYNSHRREYSEPAQVKLRQIRIGIPYEATVAQKNEAKKKIDDIAKEVNEKNFAAVAKAKSDDEYAKKGGEVGWIKRGTLERALETAMDTLTPGKVSAPVETTFGYFILQIEEKKPEVIKSLEQVKRQVAEKLVAEKTAKQFADEKRAEWDKMLASGKSIEGELKALKIDVKKTGPFSIGQGYIPNVGQADAVVDEVFQLTAANPLPKKLVPFQESFYYVKLRSVERPKEGDFAKNREMIEKSVATSLRTEVMSNWVAGLQKASTVKTELKFESKNPVAMQ